MPYVKPEDLHKVRPYPIVDPSPSFEMTIGNFNFKDYATIFGFTSFAFSLAWMQSPRMYRTTNSRFCGLIGVFAGFQYAMLSSCQRLTGVYENSFEVSKYGQMTPEKVAEIINEENRSF